jgi:2-amino-4-hydroxy-6-hydroxymethyldihydropteridine diphosphokinase
MREIIIYLSIGSNVGDRAANLRQAIAALEPSGIRLVGQSSFYETEPVDYLEQAWFLNCVVQAETVLSASALLLELRSIESRMGSSKPFAKGPRLLDMDILLYGNETIATPELQVPHPRMIQRRFVMVPLAEIAPELKHPSWARTARELADDTGDRSEVRRLQEKTD